MSESLVEEESLTRFGIEGRGCGENRVVRALPGIALRRYLSLKEFQPWFETSGVSLFIMHDNVGVCDVVQRMHAGEACVAHRRHNNVMR